MPAKRWASGYSELLTKTILSPSGKIDGSLKRPLTRAKFVPKCQTEFVCTKKTTTTNVYADADKYAVWFASGYRRFSMSNY